jgi:hypothetical protein
LAIPGTGTVTSGAFSAKSVNRMRNNKWKILP